MENSVTFFILSNYSPDYLLSLARVTLYQVGAFTEEKFASVNNVKNKVDLDLYIKLYLSDALLGFEPKITASEAAVMPFHYRALIYVNQVFSIPDLWLLKNQCIFFLIIS